jgi:hypothetical protein
VAVHRETNIKVAIKVLNKKKVQAVSPLQSRVSRSADKHTHCMHAYTRAMN